MLPAEYAKTASTKTEGEQRRRQEGRKTWIKAKEKKEKKKQTKRKREGRTGKRGARKRGEGDERGNRERDLKVMRGEEI